MYRTNFCEEFNYSFHITKKDQFQTCAVYRNKEIAGELTTDLKIAFEYHIKRKNIARDEQKLDKSRAKQDKSYHVATFDLEAVLPIPCSLVSKVYYKRKLNCYNLSFYYLQNASSTWFLWNETEGKRGSCEEGTCLLTYMKSLPITVENVCFYSDCCCGQNRNRVVTVALMHA